MRMLAALLASLAAAFAAGTVTAAVGFADEDTTKPEKAERPDKPEKADKAKGEKPDKGDKAAKEQGNGLALGRVREDGEHPLDAAARLDLVPGNPNVGLPTPPEIGESVGFKPVPGQGKAKIKLPGTDEWTTLTEGQTVPLGSTVDASEALVEVVAQADQTTGERQNAIVYGAEFKVDQLVPQGQTLPVVDLVMKGGDFDDCSDAPVARAAGRERGGKAGIVRGLWASGKGRFRTRGRHASATVRGTRWATVDRCHSTTIKVFEGIVDVADFGLGKVIPVRAGERHVARRHGR